SLLWDRLGTEQEACAPPTEEPPTPQADAAQAEVERLLQGAQFEAFGTKARARLFGQTWHLSPRSDRMGARLEGAPLKSPSGLVSEGIALGAVQVPPDGQPIILLNDRQTLGGYPKLGAIHPLDLAALAQRPSATELRLRPCTLQEAQAKMRIFLSFFHTLAAPT
ncbi:MAG: hypothetical protein ACP5IY_06815, partial [Halothiobacillaceae bacterium]